MFINSYKFNSNGPFSDICLGMVHFCEVKNEKNNDDCVGFSNPNGCEYFS